MVAADAVAAVGARVVAVVVAEVEVTPATRLHALVVAVVAVVITAVAVVVAVAVTPLPAPVQASSNHVLQEPINHKAHAPKRAVTVGLRCHVRHPLSGNSGPRCRANIKR